MECFTILADEVETRIDPHFYRPKFLELERNIAKKTNKKLGDFIVSISGGATPSREKDDELYTDKEHGIPFLRVQNITEEGLILDDVKFITKKVHETELKRSQVNDDNLLITITGRIASSCVVPKGFEGNINQHSVVIKTKDKKTAEIIATFLNSIIGHKLALRRTSGGSRPALDYEALKSIPIILNEKIVALMDNAYKEQKNKEEKTSEFLDSINDYVLDELGIKFSPIKEDKIYCINSEELENSRSDPHYFNPKFKRLLADLDKSKLKLVKLKDVAENIFNGKTPAKEDYAEEGNLILKVKCLKNNKIRWDKLSYFKGSIPVVKTIKNKDLLLLSSAHQSEYLGKNPSIVEIPQNLKDKKIFFVGELINIRADIEKINPYYILAILKLNEYYLFINREKRGQTSHLYPEDLGNVKIPLPPLSIQNKIAEEVKKRMQKAEQLQKEAKEELEKAKQEVEKIILG